MSEWNLDAPDEFMKSSLIAGASRSGKTWIAGTFPKPAFVCSLAEGGHRTLKYMDRSAWYEPSVRPRVFPVSSIAELAPHLKNDIMPGIQKGSIKTLVIELTFYSDDVVSSLSKAVEGAPGDKKPNGWMPYQTLEKHIVALDKMAKATLGLRICFTAISAPESDFSKSPTGILLAGRAVSKKMPAKCDLWGYLRAEEVGKGSIEHVLHLAQYGPYAAGHRYGARLPSALRQPTYRKLEQMLAGKGWTNENDEYVDGLKPGAVSTAVPAGNNKKDGEDLTDDLPPL